MELEFKEVVVEENYDTCLKARKDAHECTYSTTEGFGEFEVGYKERIIERLKLPEWFYIHIWKGAEIIGQLEFRSTYCAQNTGYINLVYLAPEYRGRGYGERIHSYIIKCLQNAQCSTAVLSVSRTNERALNFYKKHGWAYLKPNPKHELTDFYQLKINT